MTRLTTYHRQFAGSVRWRITPDGVELPGEGHPRTAGRPSTITRIWTQNRNHIERYGRVFDIPAELLLCLIATESAGKVRSLRKEPGYISDARTPHRVSAGLSQVLLSTASGTLGVTVSRKDLFKRRVATMLGAFYIRDLAPTTQLDPPLVLARYNAGGVYKAGPRSKFHNRFWLRTYGEHIDRGMMWLNDAIVVVRGRARGAPSWREFYGV